MSTLDPITCGFVKIFNYNLFTQGSSNLIYLNFLGLLKSINYVEKMVKIQNTSKEEYCKCNFKNLTNISRKFNCFIQIV